MNEKVVFIGLENRVEAYYLCGILSANRYRRAIESTMMSTQVSPGIVMNLEIPVFDENNKNHATISKLCEEGHGLKGQLVEEYLQAISRIVGKSAFLQD